MKKLFWSALLCAGMLLPCVLRAEVLTPDNVAVGVLKEWLSEKYGCKIDKDGDLIVNGRNGKIGISVLAKAKALRFWSNYGSYDKIKHDEMVRIANLFNYDKRLLRVAVDPENNSSVCDYYLLYPGGLDRNNFLASVEWIDGLKSVWESYVINGGPKKK